MTTNVEQDASEADLLWRESPIIKNLDGTCVIVRTLQGEGIPYHVCSREVDPGNAYDLAEVAAFWEALPDGDPRKQVYMPPDVVDPRTPEEKRRDAYVVEADPLFEQAMYYQAEADGFRLLNDLAKAAVAEEKAREYLRLYVEKKEEIRGLYPDSEEPA